MISNKETGMNRKQWVKLTITVMMVTLCTSVVFGQDQQKGQPPLPPPPAQWVAHDNYLYVLNMRSIYQYQDYVEDNMTLEQLVTLPKPQAAATSSNLKLPLPPPSGSASLLAEGNILYVLDGPYIYRYRLPDLTLQQTVTLTIP
jgi:hypothetical protein